MQMPLSPAFPRPFASEWSGCQADDLGVREPLKDPVDT